MQVTEYSGNRLRLILVGMITNSKVCSRISELITKKGGPRFQPDWAQLIATWCRDYNAKYDMPPGQNIQNIYESWASSSQASSEVLDQVEDLLDYLSDEYANTAQNNPDYILDEASEYFNQQQIKGLLERTEENVTKGQTEDAYAQLQATTRIELGHTTVIKPFDEVEPWLEIFHDEHQRPLYEYPGALGVLTHNSFTRSSLFAFMGVDKAGKSFYLMDAAFRALKNRHRVAYFEVGDLGQAETLTRLGQRVLRLPEFPQYVNWPIGWESDRPDVPILERRFKPGVSLGDMFKRMRRYSRGRKDQLRISCHYNSSITVQGIEGYLSDWAKSDCWFPDMLVIDYADILEPPAGFNEPKDQIDEVWKQLRRLSQKYNCLVLSATQTGAQAYRKKGSSLGRADFGGRKTKLATVNGMLGLNISPEDKENGVTRINWIVRRKGGGSETSQVVVAGCLAAGTPIIASRKIKYTAPPQGEPAHGNHS